MKKIIVYFIKSSVASYVLLSLLVIAGYWQISFMQHTVKYDMIDCYYPWRFMVSESLRNGILPFWNPYQMLGYPIHADPQSGAWYPITWLFGYIREYDIYSLHVEYIVHLCIAACGMFFLGNILKFDKRVSFIIATAYVFSGFFIGNSQHFTYSISGAWIPLIIAQYILLFEKQQLKHALYVAFFMFMLISGGYPAFLFILFYFLLFIFSFYCIKLYREKYFSVLKKFIFHNIIALITTLLLSAVVLTSVFYLTTYITRGGKIPLELALFCPLSPKSLLSIILPFAAIRNMDFYGTDLSMSNIYFGLITLIFFMVALSKKKPGIYWIFLFFALVCLAASMGKYFPVRKFLYDYVPLMNMFRFPGLFRLFPILFFLLIAGFGINDFITRGIIKEKRILIASICIAGGLIVTIVLSRIDGYLMMKDFLKHELFKASQISFIRQHIALQSMVQLFFASLFIISFFVFKNKKKIIQAIIIISIIDLIFAAQLNAPYTVYSEFYTPKEVEVQSNAFPKGFPIPDNTNVLLHNDTSGLGNGIFWKNLNTFHKQIAWDGFAPVVFKGYAYMADSIPAILRRLLSNPPVYLASKLYPEDSAKVHQLLNTGNNRNSYLPSESFKKLSVDNCSPSSEDTAFITSFTPEKIVVTTHSANPRLLCLLQNYYPGWKAFVNDKETEINKVNFGLLSCEVPAGTNSVEFRYNFIPVRIAYYISLLSLTAFFIFALIKLLLQKHK